MELKYFNREYYERNSIYKIAVLGPKSGKSSLINYLIGSNVAMVSEKPCTTEITKYAYKNYIYFDTSGQQDIPEIPGIDLALILIPDISNCLPFIKRAQKLYPNHLVLYCGHSYSVNRYDINITEFIYDMEAETTKKIINNLYIKHMKQKFKQRTEKFKKYFQNIYKIIEHKHKNEHNFYDILSCFNIVKKDILCGELENYGKYEYDSYTQEIIMNNVMITKTKFKFLD